MEVNSITQRFFSNFEKPLSELASEIPQYYLKKIKLKANEKEKQTALSKIKNYALANHLDIIDLDGIRINFKDGWAIVRASGTEPVLRIFAEGSTKERAEEIINLISKKLI